MKTKEEIENICGNIIDSESINDQYKQSVYEVCVSGYTKYHEDNDTSKVTRVEVVDETGRVYSKWNCSVELSYQDDGRTLKVFVK